MRIFMYLVIAGVSFSSSVLLTGCASTELVEIWSDTEFQTPALNKMLVIAISNNSLQRRIWEDAFCNDLVNHDVTAVPSYRLFPDAAPDTNQVDQLVQAKRFDGILMIRRLPPEVKAQYQPGYVTQEQNMRFDRRRDRFVTYYRNIEHYGYVDSQKVDIRLIDVWTTKNEGQMIWGATSKTPESNSDPSVQSEVVALVMTELTNRGIIAPAK